MVYKRHGEGGRVVGERRGCEVERSPAQVDPVRGQSITGSDWCFIAEQPAPAPHFEGRAALTHMC